MTDNHADTVSGGAAPDNPEHNTFDSEDLSGMELANCRVIRKLGQGAMGSVYLAEQLSLGRTVAIKVLDPKFSRDITYIERFEREAKAAARLMHYNIVQVYDYGRDKDIYYIVNEYIDGGNVQELIDAEGVVEPLKALDVILQACRGLMVAQEQSVIHRDIKPDNLMLTSDGAVKIADFGLAKVVQDDSTVTQSGMIVGTPFYMSPEQAKGLKLDSRSDLYSLGVTFFHMATGQLPFDADSVIGVLLKQISAERPDPVAVNPSLPIPLGKVIMKMMARESDSRYQTAKEAVEELESAREDVRVGRHESSNQRTMAVEIPKARADRSERYKLMHKSQILFISKREVAAQMADKMLAMLKGDTGVFVPTDEAFSANEIVEVRFSVPGREEMFSAIGVVRWVGELGGNKGIGVTFLKVNSSRRRTSKRTTAAVRGNAAVSSEWKAMDSAQPGPKHPMNVAEAIKVLTKTPLHCRLLRYYYANTGQLVEQAQVCGALGVGTRMIASALAAYEQAGLMVRQKNGLISLVWPEDEGLQREIVGWISKFGLR